MVEEKYNSESRCLKCFDMISRDKILVDRDGNELCDMCYYETATINPVKRAILKVNFAVDMPITELNKFTSEFKEAIKNYEYIKDYSVVFER